MSLNLSELLKDLITSSYVMRPNRVVLEVDSGSVRDLLTRLVSTVGEDSLYIATIEGTDLPEKGLIRLDYFINVFKHDLYVVVRTYLPRERPVIQTLIDLMPGALAGELEAHDLLGVLFEGNAYMRRSFFIPEDVSSKGIYPLRKDSGV
ncbi:MAG: NADH-quinone oxidoreductase subunit C [Zestosphaera sp.]